MKVKGIKYEQIEALIDGSKRFNELQRVLKTISPRVLSHELKELELNGFVQRKVYSTEMPVVVEYEATDYSLTLKKVLDALVEWGTMHKEKIKKFLHPIFPIKSPIEWCKNGASHAFVP